MYQAGNDNYGMMVGNIAERDDRRRPKFTVEMVRVLLRDINNKNKLPSPREWVNKFSIQNFHTQWKNYLNKEFGL
jgi:hypothetical protein